ncbi:GTP cyclohydrolase II [Streptomyces sp. NPDC007162]|uniref:GTP cyclohydrolase II n=1 Tax=Streptomyces sp. NPDC007162 TaxID=3156917 RepID=UPI0033F740EF
MTIVSFQNLSDEHEHVAVLFDSPPAGPEPLVRVHSECLTGDVLGSARCDCGPQLRESVQRLTREGGILLYLRQEGRGIGLYNKLESYGLQDLGHDTFEANRALHFPDDMRDYRVAAEMLTALGVPAIRLLSNNPDKERQLRSYGIDIRERQPTGVFATRANHRYLEAKMRLAGHEIADHELVVD